MKHHNIKYYFYYLFLFFVIFSSVSCIKNNRNNNNFYNSEIPIVFFTNNISPTGLMLIYEALKLEPKGNVAVKVHSGEPGNPHYLKPELINELVSRVNGTIIETNTAYGGPRSTTIEHYKVAEENGFTAIAPFVILDEIEDLIFPIENGKHLKENFVGGRFNDYDFHIVLSHFKGHQMGGFGGALKNLSIGYASAMGKTNIHSAGRRGRNMWETNQIAFLESMAEAALTITQRTKGKILYISVMNHLSVDCDCNGNPAPPNMADIGILGSLDPVALDQACIDLVFAAEDSCDLIERINSRNGLRTLEYAEELEIGSRKYHLVNIDE